jgi:4-hydroxythreonine-4-phosphate dehydrogenase
MRPITITPGEPAGIGPDVVLQAVQDWQGTPLVVIADPELMQTRAEQLNLPCHWPLYEEGAEHPVSILPVPCAVIPQPGKPTADNAAYILKTLVKAATGCLNDAFSAVVTGPVNKAIINESGISFAGHTDFFAALTESPCTVMTFLTDFCPVGLMTTHLPLREVSDAITPALILATATTLLHGLQHNFAIDEPHLAICGLNPHAGEDGHLGREEIDVMQPAIEQLRAAGHRISGPLSADSVFSRGNRVLYDAILSPYHDQALTAVKALGFGDGTQITLGLPFLRLSVDHGTAFNLAGSGKANSGSLLKAIQSAESLTLKKSTDHDSLCVSS